MSTHSALRMKTCFQIGNALRSACRQSRLKQGFIVTFVILFELFLLLLFRDGFRFLSALGGAGTIITGRIFALFFLGLAWMLVLSSLVSSYATFFSSPEIAFLLVRPFHMRQIVLYTFAQATTMSSWAFLFIVLPFVGAYAWHQSLHPLFILWTFLFSIPFLFLCASLGAIIVLLAVRWLPKPGKFRIFAVAVAISGILAYSMFARATIDTDSAQFNLTTAIPGMRMATHPLSPGFWMSEGIMSLTRGHLTRGLLFLALLTSTACVSTMLVEQLGGLLFYPAWQRARTAGPTRRKAIMLTKLHILRRLIPADVCAIINKDIRTFLRDPAQWSQALVFFGLLGLYFSNLRLFRYDQFPEQWRSLMTFLNIFAVSAVLSSMGSRFIYPQLSFEGHSFWMLGLSPATMPRILAAKYLLALFSTGLVSITLIFLSTRSLNLEPLIQTAALALIAAVCLSVCALSVGLGAIFIDLDEHNPSAIVSSFGGTLNIILCLCYMFVTIMPFGVLFHMRQSQNLSPAGFTRLLTAVYAWLALLTTLATTLPLWLGYRSLRKRDF